ncbi:MAG: 50S ribosomal protein L15e, partial [Candidatus Aenigmarchaeota archaeon]|nr:50S ribosomal protein L15e [Candidatus Aenigmarchaeota archaeon]
YMLQNEKKNTLAWRKQGTITRLDGPTDPARARRLGYKAKQGFLVVRVRVPKGGRKRPRPAGGRVPKKAGRFFTLNMGKQVVAEQKADRKFRNMRVLNSYSVGEDGIFRWFEVILADPALTGLFSEMKGRSFRGLTSAGKKSRGLRRKGVGAEKVR